MHNEHGRPFAGLRVLDATERRLKRHRLEGVQPLVVPPQVAPIAIPHGNERGDARALETSRIVVVRVPLRTISDRRRAAHSPAGDLRGQRGLRALLERAKHLAHHREVAELEEHERQQSVDRPVPAVEDPQPRHQPRAPADVSQRPRPSAVRLDPDQLLSRFDRGDLERGGVVDLAEHRHPVADLRVLELFEDPVGARVGGVVEQVVGVEPGLAESDLHQPRPDRRRRRVDRDRARAKDVSPGHEPSPGITAAPSASVAPQRRCQCRSSGAVANSGTATTTSASS